MIAALTCSSVGVFFLAAMTIGVLFSVTTGDLYGGGVELLDLGV